MPAGVHYAVRLAVLAAAGLLSIPAQAQQAAVNTHVLGRVDSRRSVEGGSFFAKTTTEWKQGPCTVPAGTTLEGRIARVQHKGPQGKREELALRFLNLPCPADDAQEVQPVLVAVEGMQQDTRADYIVQQELVRVFSSNLKTTASGSGAEIGGGGGKASAPGALRSGSVGNLGAYHTKPPVEQPLHLREVRGILGVSLTLPALDSDPTVLSSTDQILIDPGSRFLLVLQLTPRIVPPKAVAEKTATPVLETRPAAPPVLAPPVKEVVELENCVETGCAQADNNAGPADDQLERNLSLRAFGFRVRGNRVLRSLAEDAAVRFLGEDQLLVTFNQHALMVRSQDESARLAAPRNIRAVLFSLRTGKVLRAEDWRVSDGGPYLWPLDGGRVLAHVGNSLVVYGPGLTVERQWTPQGSVHFVRVAPSRQLIVAGVTRERHTPEQHRRLAEFLGAGQAVEEDFDLTVLDGELQVTSSRHLEHSLVLSEVLNTGMILIEPGLRDSWTLKELNWSGQQRQIVHVTSACPVRIETLPTDLILVVGCSPDQTSTWYKLVRSNGKTLLTGSAGANALLEHADGPTGAGVFAIGIAQALRPVDFGHGMVAADFQNVSVSVYRIADGRRLYAARSAKSAINRQSFALSETGDRLAILSGDDVSLYNIAGPRTTAAAPATQ